MNTLVIIANLGSLRAFRSHREDFEPEHLREFEVSDSPPAPEPVHEQVSDQAGRFPRGNEPGTPGGMRNGESHGKAQEEERRHLRALAERIEELVREEGCEMWRFAAAPAVNNRIVSLLSEPVRQRLLLNLHADLTKLPLAEVEKRLLQKAPSP